MSRHLNNLLLARLDEATMAALTPYLAVTHLEQGRVLSETHSTIDKVYFPHDGIISCVVELVGGGAIETGMFGRDGQFGAGRRWTTRCLSTTSWCRSPATSR